jgi:hypothetical protein
MSKRNRRDARKINKLRKTLRKDTLPTYIDLVRWLMDRKEADTVGGAKKIIAAGRVRSESHTLGLTTIPLEDGKEVQVPARYISARHRHSISVVPAT